MDISLMHVLDLMLSHAHVVLFGVIVGMVVGATPGLTSSNSTAIMLPFILTLDPTTGTIFVISLHAGAQMGNSFPAILLNIPGTPSSAVTTLEGYPMAREGKASLALGVCVLASACGGLIGGIISILSIPVLSSVALDFSPVELTIVILFGLVIIGQISKGGIWKGLLSGLLGLMAATCGPDPMWGVYRADFGVVLLYDGIPLVSCLVGLLAFSEMFKLLIEKDQQAEALYQKIEFSLILAGFREVLKRPVEIIRSSLIGLIVGAIPGAGGSIAAPIAYQQSMTFSSEEEKKRFGKGSVNGLMSADVSNNACVGGALIPLLTLALPGSSTDAILLVALSFHGLVLGPEFLTMNGDMAYAVLFSQFTAAICIAFVGVLLAWVAGRIINVSMTILIPIISVLAFIGGFAETQLTFGIWVMLLSGLLGYFMKKYQYVPLAFLLGLVLGGKFETNLFCGLRMGHNSFSIFFEGPIALTLWTLLVLTITFPWLYNLYKNRFARN